MSKVLVVVSDYNRDEFRFVGGDKFDTCNGELHCYRGGELVASFAAGKWDHVRTEELVGETVSDSGRPRVWKSLTEVPTNVVVEDKDGDTWNYRKGGWGFSSSGKPALYGPNEYDDCGPFTEVLSGE